MEKMMTYSEANSVLEVSLSPSNRCLSKAVAIDNGANPDPLANFDNARLVPASVVEKQGGGEGPFTITFVARDGSTVLDSEVYEKDETISSAPTAPVVEHRTFTGWMSTSDGSYLSVGSTTATANVTYRAMYRLDNVPTIEHFFIDKDGNRVNDQITINVPEHSCYGIITTKVLIDGAPVTNEWLGGIRNLSTERIPHGDIASDAGYNDYYTKLTPYGSGKGIVEMGGYVANGACLHEPVSSDGSTTFAVKLSSPSSQLSGYVHFSLYFNSDITEEYELQDSIDSWNIRLNVNRVDLGYDISKGYVNLAGKSIGYSTTVQVSGFSGLPIVQFVTETSESSFNNQFSSVTASGNTLTVTRTAEGGTFNLYKITDPADSSKFIYFGVRNKS